MGDEATVRYTLLSSGIALGKSDYSAPGATPEKGVYYLVAVWIFVAFAMQILMLLALIVVLFVPLPPPPPSADAYLATGSETGSVQDGGGGGGGVYRIFGAGLLRSPGAARKKKKKNAAATAAASLLSNSLNGGASLAAPLLSVVGDSDDGDGGGGGGGGDASGRRGRGGGDDRLETPPRGARRPPPRPKSRSLAVDRPLFDPHAWSPRKELAPSRRVPAPAVESGDAAATASDAAAGGGRGGEAAAAAAASSAAGEVASSLPSSPASAPPLDEPLSPGRRFVRRISLFTRRLSLIRGRSDETIGNSGPQTGTASVAAVSTSAMRVRAARKHWRWRVSIKEEVLHFAQVISAWAAMDVFCLAIGVAVAEMGIVAEYTLSHQPQNVRRHCCCAWQFHPSSSFCARTAISNSAHPLTHSQVLTIMKAFCGGADACLLVHPRILPGFWLTVVAAALGQLLLFVVFALSGIELLEAERSSATLLESERLDKAIESLTIRIDRQREESGRTEEATPIAIEREEGSYRRQSESMTTPNSLQLSGRNR